MPKFKIELELNSINERILIADYDTSINSNETLTFNEQLQAAENDVFNLSFSISNNLGRPNIEIGQLINVGRPLWLYTYSPDRSIRMVITSVAPVIGSENVIYKVSAIDYGSFVFARNNAGLNLNTITDQDFLNWLEDSSYTTTNITSIGTYILERGWLRNSSGDGWSISTNVSLLVNLSISGSNTYGALIELAKLTNTNLKIDYVNQIFYFIDREASNLNKNYAIQRNFNMNSLSVTYSGENLYSLLYVTGGSDSSNEVITLGQETPYLDSFVEPDLDYYVNSNLLTSNEKDNIINTQINTNLKTLNEDLQQAAINRFTAESKISDLRAEIEAKAEEVMLTENIETFSQDYSNLVSFFEKYRKDETTSKTFTVSTTPIKVILNNLPEGASNYNLDYPLQTSYDSGFQIIGDANTKVVGEFKVLFEDTGGLTPYIQNGITFYLDFSEANSNFIFDETKFNIIEIQASYFEIYQRDVYEIAYPFLELLDLYNGQQAIDDEKQRVQDTINFYKSEWDKDYLHEQCLLENETSGLCDDYYMPESSTLKNGVIESIRKRYDDYKLVIGSYTPVYPGQTQNDLSSTELGKFTLIKNLLDQYSDLYEVKTNTTRQLPAYKDAVTAKQNFWYNLKENRQHIFQEGYYENTSFGTAEQLFLQGEFIYEQHKVPKTSVSVSYINISDIIGVNVNEIEVGDFIKINEEKVNFLYNDTKLKVAGYSKELRNDKNIQIEIFRYDLYNSILEKIMALSQ